MTIPKKIRAKRKLPDRSALPLIVCMEKSDYVFGSAIAESGAKPQDGGGKKKNRPPEIRRTAMPAV
ncbi:MAG: hypothetical protein C6P35_08860 [Cohnella sp.]|jgi:hypothetical protein|nr:MAG: hypothetical protein C6P35_08860 [Cohnella sp.]